MGRTDFRGAFALALLALAVGCARVGDARTSPPSNGRDASSDAPASGDGAVSMPPVPAADAQSSVKDAATGCINLQCRQVACDGPPTSLGGTVYAPNGTLPLYNVIVYVPNAPLEPFKPGISCDRCGVVASGHPVVSAVSDAQGHFTLNNVPAGKDIPLVVQVGKWRRQVTIPNVTACQQNVLTDSNLTRLPRNRKEGDIPSIAVATGECDQLGCVFAKIGVDAAEFGVAGDNKAIIYYHDKNEGDLAIAGPPNMRESTELWSNETTLANYDMTLLSCGCGENLETKPGPALAAVTNYVGRGGRIFGSHYSYVWLRDSPNPMFAQAASIPGFTGETATFDPMTVDTSFPKGKALADWLMTVNPTTPYGKIEGRQIFNDVVSVRPGAAQVWANSPSSGNGGDHPRIVTVNAPVGLPADQQCGRAALLTAHITPSPGYYPPGDGVTNRVFPGVCGKELTKGEEALAFLLFDLAACIQDDTRPVIPPIIVP